MNDASAKAIAIIPARWASTRFPGKALADRTGKPLIQHVFESAFAAKRLSRIVVATDDARIERAARDFGAEVVMTSPDHPNGGSRCAQAADLLELPDDAIVVNAQGDEPELDPVLIDAAIEALLRSEAPMATIASPFADDEDPADPNIVKVVRRLDGCALYFSRALIPSSADQGGVQPLKHFGLYAYRRWFLRELAALPTTPLERAERLEQLRALEHGYDIAVAVRRASHHGVDTPEQYEAFVQRWRAAERSGSLSERPSPQ